MSVQLNINRSQLSYALTTHTHVSMQRAMHIILIFERMAHSLISEVSAELCIATRGQRCSDHVNDLTGKQPGRAERRQAEERWQPRQWLSFREHSLFLEQTGMPLSISYIQ